MAKRKKTQRRSNAKTKNAIDILKDDHDKLRTLLTRLAATSVRGAKTRERVLDDIHRELEVHTAIEEEIFYPAIREAANNREAEEMHYEFVEEHYLAGEVELPRTLDVEPDTDEFTAHVAVLKELITHHLKQEEERMFPRARKLCSSEQLVELGQQMMARKKELMSELKKAA